ncbi:retrovirus-related pol polyprotein from transposon TNT 1-94 [Tanacetum coccineum]
MKKMYCLVVTDDFSRFTWVFFLATEDETSGILMSFITRIENLVDNKVKVIRCDNGTEFKNKEMNQFCEMKGILRQYSVARTPQQNGVAERRNRTLIEAARTMLADSKLPTTFWAEAVNTACYADEGFFVGYSLNSKAFRVFNSRTRIVEENLHIRFSESTPNVVGSGPDWIFDIDALTRTMNYEPIVAGTQSNGFADPKSSQDDGSKPSSDDGKKVDEDPRKDSECNDQEKEDNVNSTNNVNAASTNEVNVVGGKTSIELPFDPNMPSLEDYAYLTPQKMMKMLVIKMYRGYAGKSFRFKLQEVWTLVDLPYGKRIEAIRLFLAYASFKNFMVYQMDVKSAFLYGKIEEEVYVCQSPGFEDLNFPNRVYKVGKALYGFHQALRLGYENLVTYPIDIEFQREKIDKTLFIKRYKGNILLVQVYVDDIIFFSTKKELCNAFEKLMYEKFQMSSMGELTFFLGLQVQQKKDGIFISQDKYIDEILKKFRLTEVKIASTPIETQKPLLEDENGEEVDVHMYRIFKYLKGQPKLGLWYPKDSPFDLIAYTNMVANSTTEAEYVAALSCCGQVLWIQNQLLDYRDCNEKKLIQMVKNHTGKNVADLLTKAFDVKTVNEEVQLQALVDGKKVIIIESTVRRDFHLEDAEGVDCLPNATIFEQLTLMGYEKLSQKLNFYKAFFSPQWKFLIHTILQCLSSKTTAWNEFSNHLFSYKPEV